MIPCIQELQLNKYKAVHISSNKDLFSRYGERVSVSSVKGVTASFNGTKLDGFAEAQKLVDQFLIDEREAYEAQQAELDRLKAESEELKTLKDNNV